MISNKIIIKEFFMELVYLWVESYKNIEKQGFNFSPNLVFDFKYEYVGSELKNDCSLLINNKEELENKDLKKIISINLKENFFNKLGLYQKFIKWAII